ncbi:MAG TPA: hypothetical protein PKA74_11015 [Bauldia sp.]|nr:hypothetical protein [Bauldia sp.]
MRGLLLVAIAFMTVAGVDAVAFDGRHGRDAWRTISGPMHTEIALWLNPDNY